MASTRYGSTSPLYGGKTIGHLRGGVLGVDVSSEPAFPDAFLQTLVEELTLVPPAPAPLALPPASERPSALPPPPQGAALLPRPTRPPAPAPGCAALRAPHAVPAAQ